MDLVWLQVERWKKVDGLLHGFLGRRGGKSTGVFASLNLSFRVGDDPQVVKDNLCDMKKVVGVHDLRIVTMKQAHGDHIVEVKDKSLKEAGAADGMVTEERELFLGVVTADCVPLLFSVSGRNVVAAVHSGWRGTLAGITPKMVRYLKDRHDVDPASIEVALGPAIGQCCYEVREDVSVPLIGKWGSLAEGCLERRDGRTFLDLRDLNALLLEEAGVPPAHIFMIGPCTSCAREDFFSYRRERGKTGLQMSFIGWL
ncbi:MAG: peptidoglycan editing factor PgeF [Candidatus Binatia bacterium]